jgi:hypothetical protein
MGHHYVPQKYLRSFESRPGFVWQYDKQGGEPKEIAIKKAAQAPKFYEQADEEALNAFVEAPANLIITRLLRGPAPLPREDRIALSLYIATMLRRVPYRRERAYELYPESWAATIADIREQLLASADISAEMLETRLAEVEESDTRHRDSPPESVHSAIREPWPTLSMVNAVFGMTWRVLKTGGPCFFATSDNPVHFFEGYGIGTRESEIVFPLSTKHALFGSWQGPLCGLYFGEAAQSLVKEANRRVAHKSSRIAFYHEHVPWLQPLMRKKAPYLSRIAWS